MAKFRSIRNSFLGGEVSPTAFGRTDLPQYGHACEKLQNMIPLLSGGAYRRPGSFWEIGAAASGEYAPGLIPFVVSKDEAYAVWIGHGSPNTPFISVLRPTSNIAKSTGTVVTNGSSHPWLPATANNGNGSYDEWQQVQYAQSVDTMVLVHPNRQPQVLLRRAIDDFLLISFYNYAAAFSSSAGSCIPFLKQNITAATIAYNGAGGLTPGSAGTLVASVDTFFPGHVGAYYKVNHAGTYGVMLVTGYTDSKHVSVIVLETVGSTAATALWWESAWSDYRGWPRSVCFFQDRLGFGGNANNRDSIWFSQTSNYFQMSIPDIQDPNVSGDPTGSQPFTAALNSQQLNEIQWLSPGPTLFVGTLGDEWLIDRQTDTAGFGADNASALRQTSYGSTYLPAVRFGNEVLFPLASGFEVRSLVFNQLQNAYIAEPVQLYYDEYPQHDLSANINRQYRSIAWDETRKTLWCVDTRGNLFGMTRDRNLQINAWHSHRMGGYDNTHFNTPTGTGGDASIDPAYFNCAGSVISAMVLPNPIIGMNDIWLVAQRYINGAFSYNIERIIGGIMPFESAFSALNLNISGNYEVDACAYGKNLYPDPESDVFQGTLTHLEGQTVVGVAQSANGLFKVTATGVVSSGAVTLAIEPPDYEEMDYYVSFGLPYRSIVKPLRIDTGSVIGTAQGANKRVHEAFVRFYRTISANVGRDDIHFETIIFRDSTQPMKFSPELYTGDKRVKLASDLDRDGYIYIFHDSPFPFAVMAVILEGMSYDG